MPCRCPCLKVPSVRPSETSVTVMDSMPASNPAGRLQTFMEERLTASTRLAMQVAAQGIADPSAVQQMQPQALLQLVQMLPQDASTSAAMHEAIQTVHNQTVALLETQEHIHLQARAAAMIQTRSTVSVLAALHTCLFGMGRTVLIVKIMCGCN